MSWYSKAWGKTTDYVSNAHMHSIAELGNSHWGVATGLGAGAGALAGASAGGYSDGWGGAGLGGLGGLAGGGLLGAGAKAYGNMAIRNAYRGFAGRPWGANPTGMVGKFTQQFDRNILI